MSNRKTILILIDWYLPGRKAGGPVKSVESLVWALKDEFFFKIITTDTDLGEKHPYASVKNDTWYARDDGSSVFYMKKEDFSAEKLAALINSTPHDVLYLNSFYSPNFSVLPLRLHRKKKISGKIILAPRGMLSEGALRIKAMKKKLFILYSKLTGLHRNITWHATYNTEVEEIKRVFGNASVGICPNFSKPLVFKDHTKKKEPGSLSLFFLGRVSKVKNLHVALEALRLVKTSGTIKYDIYGNEEDAFYLQECRKLIGQLPPGIRVEFKGEIPNDAIAEKVSHYDFLFLPTSNENFGHSIFESLQCGVPVIISNKTPWKDLEKKNCGWDKEPEAHNYTAILEKCIAMDNAEYLKMSRAARALAMEKANLPSHKEMAINLFNL